MHLGNTPDEIELQRKLLLMRFFAVAGNLVMVPFMILSFALARWEAALILVVVIVSITWVIVIAHRSQRTRLASITVATELWVFACYLTVTGGVNGTGVYFAFSLIVLMIMIAGLRYGTVLGVLFCVAEMAAFVWQPGFAYDYPEGTRARITASTIFIVLLTIVAEWIHLQSYNAIRFTAETHRRNALTDPLTTLVNRSGLERRMEQWTDPNQPAAAALIDIDNFKAINDQYGHDVGDQTLVTFARVLRNNVKREDVVCRWGGEEFIILFEKMNEQDAAQVVEELRQLVVGRTFQFDKHELSLSFSAGIASFVGESGFKAALKQADNCVYSAKRAGRNRVVSSQQEMQVS